MLKCADFLCSGLCGHANCSSAFPADRWDAHFLLHSSCGAEIAPPTCFQQVFFCSKVQNRVSESKWTPSHQQLWSHGLWLSVRWTQRLPPPRRRNPLTSRILCTGGGHGPSLPGAVLLSVSSHAGEWSSQAFSLDWDAEQSQGGGQSGEQSRWPQPCGHDAWAGQWEDTKAFYKGLHTAGMTYAVTP